MTHTGRLVGALGALFLAGQAACPAAAQPAPRDTLRIVLVNDLGSIDPVASTAAFVRNHGFMVYDQIMALDSAGVARPQMAERHEASADGMTHRFTLREGLAFHDGTPVRAADAVASIRRWAARDVVGRALAAATASMEVVDDRTFEIRLSRPFALVAEALARPTASALFVMPERIAQTPPTTQITDATGSGPFIFERAAWQPGNRAVYRRNPAYRPRSEAPDGLAGGKVARVERIEWLNLPDPATAAAALARGEIDFWEQPSGDVLPLLARDRNIRLMPINAAGSVIWLRVNHLHPPFNDPRARQAVLRAISQPDNLAAAGVREEDRVAFCAAYFLCGTPLESRAGSEGLERPDPERARALLRESGYDGRPVVFLNASDSPINNAVTLVMADALRRAGFNMDVPSMDWATVTQRRGRREAPNAGGWDMFVTVANVLDARDPLTNLYLASPCGEGGLPGWPCDQRLEDLRRSWWEEPDADRRRAILDQVQAQALRSLPYINAGQFRTPAAMRANLDGVRATIIPVFWGVEKR
ncbi:ABC transporter substrate-binding protein [Roseomonas sp. CCTCC AB2023176]|uniref:ABC transporter substrate-binding protein n=1 Tax=Roseomonas sp. CCTCC AB2023176 TaxID=3342640 RepID=UPI0035E220DB